MDRIPARLGESERLLAVRWRATDARPTTKADRAVVYFGEPISSSYVLIPRTHLVNVTILEHERWKRAHVLLLWMPSGCAHQQAVQAQLHRPSRSSTGRPDHHLRVGRAPLRRALHGQRQPARAGHLAAEIA